MSQDSKFVTIERQKRIWAVGSIHGEAEKLKKLHIQLVSAFKPGDMLIYMGNVMGRGPEVRETIHEMLSFRRLVILQEAADVEDVVFLRGCQEEMLYKLRHIPFAKEPEDVLQWMNNQGVNSTLEAYGTSCEEGMKAARLGMNAISQWMNSLKAAMRKLDGHEQYMDALKRAAYTENKKLLFVSANVVKDMPLDAQTDAFWWGTQDFRELDHPYGGFERVVRGYDHRQQGYYQGPHHLCLDGGCGFGGKLIAACFEENGALVDRIEI